MPIVINTISKHIIMSENPELPIQNKFTEKSASNDISENSMSYMTLSFSGMVLSVVGNIFTCAGQMYGCHKMLTHASYVLECLPFWAGIYATVANPRSFVVHVELKQYFSIFGIIFAGVIIKMVGTRLKSKDTVKYILHGMYGKASENTC
jgi:hypothetical protein